MLIKIDHKVASAISEDRADVVAQLVNSSKMYSWVLGEDVGEVIDSFALANPHATFGDFVEWTKRTYMDRLRGKREGLEFIGFKLQGDYDPTKSRESKAEFGKHGEAAKGVSVINDAVSSKPKRVALPGQEAAVDAADEAARRKVETDLGEQKDGPGTPDYVEDNPIAPPTSIIALPPLEPGQQADLPEDPLAAFKARKF